VKPAPFALRRVLRAWDATSPTTLAGMLSPDHFHMGDAGYACFARSLAGDIAQGGGFTADVGASKL